MTEPVWILFFVGLAVAGWGFVKRAETRRIAGADPGLVYPAADRVHRLTHAVVRSFPSGLFHPAAGLFDGGRGVREGHARMVDRA